MRAKENSKLGTVECEECVGGDESCKIQEAGERQMWNGFDRPEELVAKSTTGLEADRLKT